MTHDWPYRRSEVLMNDAHKLHLGPRWASLLFPGFLIIIRPLQHMLDLFAARNCSLRTFTQGLKFALLQHCRDCPVRFSLRPFDF